MKFNFNNNNIKDIFINNGNDISRVQKGYIGIDSKAKLFYENNNENHNFFVDYIKLDYITNLGDAYFYIDIPINNSYPKFGSLDINFSSVNKNSTKIIFGYYISNTNYFDIYINNNNTNMIISNGTTNRTISSINASELNNLACNIVKNSKYHIILNNDDNKKITYSSSINKPSKLCLFKGYNNLQEIIGNGGISIYSFKYYYDNLLSENNLAIDLIPCIEKATRKIGMYDIVSDNFYSSIGTEEFEAGIEGGSEEEESGGEGGDDGPIDDNSDLFGE